MRRMKRSRGLASLEGTLPFEEMVYMEEPPLEELFLQEAPRRNLP